MRDDKVIQGEIDAAQADLEKHVEQLKDVVTDKLETPVAVIDAGKSILSVIQDHALLATASAFVLGLALGALRPR